jgi:hypothetical protein
LLYAGSGEDFVVFAFRESTAGVEIADGVKNDPEVGVGVVNVVRSCGGETEKQAELNDDENQGKNNAGEGNREAYAVMEKVAPSKKSHANAPKKTFKEIYVGAGKK